MTDSDVKSLSKPRRNRWLTLIAAFKLGQAVLFIAVGVGALRLLHKDVGDLVSQLVDHLRFINPESRLVEFLLDKSSLIDDHILRRIGAGVFIYAGLDIIEGTGLYLEKIWGEYMTLIITASFLPWEIFEVIRRLTWIRASLLAVNALVFLYLLKIVIERAKHRRGTSEVV
jgi:uncharacterized membrane protein (DUF2068 family)